MIVSREDYPVYTLSIENIVKKETATDKQHMYELVLNAALDPVDIIQWQSPNMYLKQVDKFD